MSLDASGDGNGTAGPTLVRDVMTTRPTVIDERANLRRAAQLIGISGANDLMVIGVDGRFVGVLAEGDILRSALPDLDQMLSHGGAAAELGAAPISPLIITNPIMVGPDDPVAKVATILVERAIRTVAVLDDGQLVGTLSRADICRALVGGG